MVNRRSVSNEIRALIIRSVVEQGESISDAMRSFNLPRTTIYDIVKKHRETGEINKSSKGGAINVKLTEQLKTSLINIMNDNTSKSILDVKIELAIDVNVTTVWRWVKKLGYTFKMTRPIPSRRNDEDVKAERKLYVRWYNAVPFKMRYSNLIFIDESPFHLHMMRSHSWAKRGVTPNPILAPSKGHNVTMILALNASNILYSEAVYTTVNANIYQEFLAKVAGVLGEGDFTIVMDNAPIHHGNKDFYDNYAFEIKYLPAYSPFLNPCEEVFSQLKHYVRKQGTILGTRDLTERMLSACGEIKDTHLENYFHHSESFFERCSNGENIGRD